MKKAILLIGHGSSKQSWVDRIDHLIQNVDSKVPIIISFLEKVEGRLIRDGIKRLREIEATDLLIVPLFVSSGSTHMLDIKNELAPFIDEFQFTYASAMDDSPYVVDHIITEAKRLSIAERDEVLLLIGHGSDKEGFDQKWHGILESLKDKISQITDYRQVEYATFLPNTMITKLDNLVEKKDDIIVIPLFLSEGIFTNRKIPNILKNYQVKYNGVSYIEGNWIADWITDNIKSYTQNEDMLKS